MRVSVALLLCCAVASAWDEDPRCPGTKRRMLDVESWDDSLADEEDFDPLEHDYDTSKLDAAALRGSMVPSNVTASRSLASLPGTFSIKMYWEKGFCWQEEYERHRRWCWECIGSSCNEGDELWFQICDSKKATQLFSYKEDSQGRGGRIQVAGQNLCLQRVSNNGYQLKGCGDNIQQIVVGFKWDGNPFELQPLQSRTKCINQHHHPKAGEVVENTNCRTARIWHTNLFELVNLNGKASGSNEKGVGLRLRSPECTDKQPCDVCQGDCDNDKQCKDNLVCFQRQDRNGEAPVPGCSGSAVKNRDYCISKNSPSSPTPAPGPTGARKPLDRNVRECRPNKQCDACQGDCSNDKDCKGNLKCFNKDNGDPNDPHVIPGCFGIDTSRTDWCYQP